MARPPVRQLNRSPQRGLRIGPNNRLTGERHTVTPAEAGRHTHRHTVTPAKAGVQGGRYWPLTTGHGPRCVLRFPHPSWVPAFAGMTIEARDGRDRPQAARHFTSSPGGGRPSHTPPHRIGVGRADWIRLPLPPNRTGGFPASGSPVGGSPPRGLTDQAMGCDK
jgi:hypothetical protein